MKFDRNTIIGFAILAVLFFFYFYYNNLQQGEYQKEKARQDSIANALKPKVDTATLRLDSMRADSQRHVTSAGMFVTAANGAEQLVYAENQVFKVAFSNKGGQPKFIELKKFKSAVDSQQVKLAGTDFNRISYAINTSANQSAQTGDLFFSNGKITPGPDGSQIVTFELKGGDSSSSASYVTHQFIIYPNDYKIDFNITLAQPGTLLSQGTMNMVWQYDAKQQESDIDFEKQNTQIGYMENDNFDYHTISRKDHVDFEKSVEWVGVRQRFFNTFLWARDKFSGGKIAGGHSQPPATGGRLD